MTNAEFNKLFPVYDNDIKAIARKLARRDNDLCDDLYSIGCITFWELDLSKATQNVSAYVKSSVRSRMIDFLRKERSYDKDSLNVLLALGNQVVEGEEGPVLIKQPPRTQYEEFVDAGTESVNTSQREED